MWFKVLDKQTGSIIANIYEPSKRRTKAYGLWAELNGIPSYKLEALRYSIKY